MNKIPTHEETSVTPCCDDIAVHSHDGGKTLRKNGLPFELRWTKTYRKPFARTYRAASRHLFAIRRNRYGNAVTIGIAFQVGTRVLSIVWAQPHVKGHTPAQVQP